MVTLFEQSLKVRFLSHTWLWDVGRIILKLILGRGGNTMILLIPSTYNTEDFPNRNHDTFLNICNYELWKIRKKRGKWKEEEEHGGTDEVDPFLSGFPLSMKLSVSSIHL